MKKMRKNLSLISLCGDEIKKQEMNQLNGGTGCSATCQCSALSSINSAAGIYTYIQVFIGI
jgi:natural product precursor